MSWCNENSMNKIINQLSYVIIIHTNWQCASMMGVSLQCVTSLFPFQSSNKYNMKPHYYSYHDYVLDGISSNVQNVQ